MLIQCIGPKSGYRFWDNPMLDQTHRTQKWVPGWDNPMLDPESSDPKVGTGLG